MGFNSFLRSDKYFPFIEYCQFGCEILKMVGQKMQDFCPRIDVLKGNCFKTILWLIMVLQKVPKSYFQRQFSMSKINGIFSKKNSFKNINLGDQRRRFFSNFNFWTTLFSKFMPKFWRTGAPCTFKIQSFLWVYWFWPIILLFRTHHL